MTGDRLRAPLLALALALSIVALVRPDLSLGTKRLDLRSVDMQESEPVALRACRVTFPSDTVRRIPIDADVFEDGHPLEYRDRPETAAFGSACFAVSERSVIWAATDGTDPRSNRRRYEIAFVPTRYELLRSPAWVLVFLATSALLLISWSRGLELWRPSSAFGRVTLVTAAALALGLGVSRGPDAIGYGRDSASYIQRSPTRSTLYPDFLDILDRTPGVPRMNPAPTDRPRPDAHDRFTRVVRAQRVLTIASLTILLWVLSSGINVWQLAGLLLFASAMDVEHLGGDSCVWWNVGQVMSEGLNHALVFTFAAALFAYLRQGSAAGGAALGLSIGFLLWNRPANAALVSAIPLAWVHDWTRSDWKRATRNALGIASVVGLVLLLGTLDAYRVHGRFRLHAFTGRSLFGVALQVATPDDAEAFEDPSLRELARACLQDPRRVPVSGPESYVEINLYEIGLRAARERTVGVPPADREYVIDDQLGVLGARFVRRHPLAYARLVVRNFMMHMLEPGFLSSELLAAVLALVLYRRTRRGEALFAFAIAALPVVYMIPSCCFNVPGPRYHSQVYFADYVALPLALLLYISGSRDGSSTRP